MDVQRYFLDLSYRGTAYHGWQGQPNAVSVQTTIEGALGTLLKEKIAIVGAGRTDAGVHAKQMYAHFETSHAFDPTELTFRLNAFLPQDIAIKTIRKVAPDAHARFDATERTYEYWVVREKNPFYIEGAHLFMRPLNVEAMNQAAGHMMAHSDFKCFSRSNTDVKTFNCSLKEAIWQDRGALLVFTITADRFLRNMVRAVVGTLLEVGVGKRKPAEMDRLIESRDRTKAGPSVPAKGLYLTKVIYPETIFT